MANGMRAMSSKLGMPSKRRPDQPIVAQTPDERLADLAARYRASKPDPLPAAALRALGVPAPRESRPVDEDDMEEFL